MTVNLSSLQALAARLSGRGGSLRPALGAGAAALKRAVEDHYRSLGGFLATCVAGQKVAISDLQDTSAAVTIDSRELAHHIRGGTVRPLPPRRALAIPLTPEARAAGYPSNNRIPGVFRPKGKRVLGVSEGGVFRALWALASSVTHRAHPEKAPRASALSETAGAAMRAEIDRALRQG